MGNDEERDDDGEEHTFIMRDDDGEEHTVFIPNSRAAIESDPSKAVIDRPGVDGVKHLDKENAIYIGYLDLIRDRARAIGDEVQDEIRQYAQPENDKIYVSPRSVSVKLIEMNTLTLTYFEGVGFQFLQWAMEADHELESRIRHHAPSEFPTEGPPRSWDEEVREKFQKYQINAKAYAKALDDVGFLENADPIHSVKDTRNHYVHNPEKALELRTSTDSYPGSAIFDQDNRPEALQEENLGDVVSDILVDCMAALDEIEEMIEKHLPIDDRIYEAIYKE